MSVYGFSRGVRAIYAPCTHQPQHEWKQRTTCMRLTMEARKKKATSSKRVRHVYDSSELVHIWAHQVVDHGRNSCGSIFFRGPVIFSWGEHFPAARIVERNGKKVVLVSNRKSSSSTSGHLSGIRSAVSHLPQFEVRNVSQVVSDEGRWGGGWFNEAEPDAATHSGNLAQLLKDLEAQIAAIGRARSSWSKKWKTRSARDTRNNILAYAKFFRLKTGKLPEVPRLSGSQLAKLERHQKQLTETREARSLERNAKIIEAWKRGANVQLPGGRHRWRNPLPVMLRIRTFGADQEVEGEVGRLETSLGAQIPLSHAYRALKFVRAIVAAGREFVSNGKKFHVGHYAIERVSADGTIKAGCHTIPYSEVQRLAPQLESIFANKDGIAWG